jgi:hypothetical protein
MVDKKYVDVLEQFVCFDNPVVFTVVVGLVSSQHNDPLQTQQA